MFRPLSLAPLALALLPLELQAASLSTGYVGGNSQDGVMFDILVGGQDLTLESFDLNLETGTTTVEFYYKTGSYAGSEAAPGDWTFVTSTTLTSLAEDAPTAFDVSDVTFAAGTVYSFYLTATANPNFSYNNGTAAGNVAASNADLTIYEGIGIEYAFGGIFVPRVWNGTVYYSVDAAVPLPAGLPLAAGGLAMLGLLSRRRAAG
ncbi:VPLPA-CTERM sorting domain-containing protein [Mangrovicoccus ximenensis]|uniref:VPLPA-CTERM sorting domain-containing protein n=1 Tax=Mangrovicoccus ximenensis TaxID=1911570 RepID=UPI000D3B79CB|nr:VPLPA-CTERM sorting domain-containing protein [Mangrovicoccus ximenensis]